MNKNKLKKIIGEKNAQKLLLYFGEDLLLENLPKMFAIPKEVRHIDFTKEENIVKLRNLFNSEEKDKKNEPIKTAKELLAEKGYILDDTIKTDRDYLKYKKYYKNGEELCKFRDLSRIKSGQRVFWIIKKDIDKIKRDDFVGKEKRQDEYGTSCCSISISKDKKNVLQICNRYNHKVSAPDATFNCNLDQIAIGLRDAFNKDYGLSLGKVLSVEFDDFYFMDNKYWHYNREINGKKYGENTIDGKIYNPDNFLIFDNFILDLSKKELKCLDNYGDGFVDIFNNKVRAGAKIIVSKVDILDDENIVIIKQ